MDYQDPFHPTNISKKLEDIRNLETKVITLEESKAKYRQLLLLLLLLTIILASLFFLDLNGMFTAPREYIQHLNKKWTGDGLEELPKDGETLDLENKQERNEGIAVSVDFEVYRSSLEEYEINYPVPAEESPYEADGPFGSRSVFFYYSFPLRGIASSHGKIEVAKHVASRCNSIREEFSDSESKKIGGRVYDVFHSPLQNRSGEFEAEMVYLTSVPELSSCFKITNTIRGGSKSIISGDRSEHLKIVEEMLKTFSILK